MKPHIWQKHGVVSSALFASFPAARTCGEMFLWKWDVVACQRIIRGYQSNDWAMPHGRKSFGQGAQCQMLVRVQIPYFNRRKYDIIILISLVLEFYVVCSELYQVVIWPTPTNNMYSWKTNLLHFALLLSQALLHKDMMTLWHILTWPMKSAFLFLFLYVLTMTKTTHPNKHNHFYLTLSFGSQIYKLCSICPVIHPSVLWAVMNILWLYFMSVLAITAVISDQNIDRDHIRGEWFKICLLEYFLINFCQPAVLMHLTFLFY